MLAERTLARLSSERLTQQLIQTETETHTEIAQQAITIIKTRVSCKDNKNLTLRNGEGIQQTGQGGWNDQNSVVSWK